MLQFKILLTRIKHRILLLYEFMSGGSVRTECETPELRGGFSFVNSILFCISAAGIVSSVVFIVLRVKYGGFKGLYSKAIASFFFLLTALAAANVNSGHGVFAGLIVFGLALASREISGSISSGSTKRIWGAFSMRALSRF